MDVVALEEYVKLGEAYHEVAEHDGDLPNCEVDLCDRFHAVTYVAAEVHRLIVSGYLDDLVEMYDEIGEGEGLPVWADLTDEQQNAAISAVQFLHEEVDEYHAMVDAIEESK